MKWKILKDVMQSLRYSLACDSVWKRFTRVDHVTIVSKLKKFINEHKKLMHYKVKSKEKLIQIVVATDNKELFEVSMFCITVTSCYSKIFHCLIIH